VTPDQREVCRLSPRDHVATGSAGQNHFLCSSLCALCRSTPIRTIAARHWLSPSSFTRCPVSSPCGLLSLTPLAYGAGRTTGLPRFADITAASVRRWLDICAERVRGSRTWPRTFWSKRFSSLRLFLCDDAYDASPGLTIPLHPSSQPPLLLAVAVTARALAALPKEEATLSRELTTPV
jgi:hypothetical protein